MGTMGKRNENILLLGLGGVGYYLAKRLTHEGHALTIIEPDGELLKRADGEVDARLIQGDAMNFSRWRDLGADQIDYLIAVTDNDAVNIMACLIGDRVGVRKKIARVRAMEIWEDRPLLSPQDLKLNLVIRPEELAAQEIARLMRIRTGNIVIDIAEGRMQLMATRIDERSFLANQQIKDISKMHDDFNFRIVAIARGANTIVPSGDQKLLPQDHVFVLAHREDLPSLMLLAGVSHQKGHRVMIVGGGLTGRRTAELLDNDFPVKLIEQDEQRAVELSYTLKRTEILNGDGSEADTLISAGVLDADTVITATGDNETNIMTSVLAKHLIRSQPGELQGKEAKSITLVKREEYLTIASAMGSDIVLNKKVMAGNEILKYIRRGKMLSMARLHGFDAEVVELVADKGAPITHKPLYQLSGLKGKIIIGGVSRKDDWEIAVGSTQVRAGDRVIAVCASKHLPELQRLLLK